MEMKQADPVGVEDDLSGNECMLSSDEENDPPIVNGTLVVSWPIINSNSLEITFRLTFGIVHHLGIIHSNRPP